MSSSFSENLKCCSTDSWETIIPQLFARLDHPDAFVRKEVCDLISRIGVVSPSKVVYHTVVGSLSQKMTESATFESAYSNIINSMKSSGSANLLWEVERMVVELQRITVLWDEKVRCVVMHFISRLIQHFMLVVQQAFKFGA